VHLRSEVQPHERESWTKKGVRLFVSRPAVPQNSESQRLSGKGSTKEKREKLELSHPKPSCRTFPTCNDVCRFDGSRRELSPLSMPTRLEQRSSKQVH